MRRNRAGSAIHVQRCLIGILCLLIGTFACSAPALAAGEPSALPDFPVPNGHFYTQASGAGDTSGFAITDDDGVDFNRAFNRLGGVDRLGYPSSARFMFGGFVTQATQKALLQWRPRTGQVDFVNVFDIFTQRGLDPTLEKTRLIPPTEDNSADNQLTWPQIVSRHLALLDQNAAIKARYFADPDPIDDFGLPQGREDFGGVYVVRCQRAAFQQWRINTPFANAGDVTIVNAGDLAKEFGLIPASAAKPVPASSQLIAPLGQEIHASATTISAARQVAAHARSALVRVVVALDDGTGIASGIVLDRGGDILTEAHVVDGALSVTVTFADGSSTAAQIADVDSDDDLAILRVPASAMGPQVTVAPIADGSELQAGQDLVGLGFTPFFPTPPATRLGIFQSVIPGSPEILRSNTYILPGDSGGMLLNLSGQVVGINEEIRFTHQSEQPMVSYAIDANDAVVIARRLLQESRATESS